MIPSSHVLRYLAFLGLMLCFFACQRSAVKEGIYEIEENSKQVGRIDSSYTFKGQVSAFFQDSQNNYWIGSKSSGLCVFNGQYYTYYTVQDGLVAHEITSIQEDQHGRIWVDQGAYLSVFDGKAWTVYAKGQVLSLDILGEGLQLSDDDLWFSDVSRLGVFRYDGERLSFISFEDKSIDLKLDNQHFFISGVTDLVSGQIWFGTIMQGVLGFDGKQFEHIHNGKMDFESEEEFLHVRSILSDSKGNLWIGNNGIGLLKKNANGIQNFSKEKGLLLPFEEFESNIFSKRSELNTGLQAVFAIEEDAEGNIWFGERDSGLWKYDGNQLYNYPEIYQVHGLEEMIWDICAATDGHVYCLLIDGRIFSFDGDIFSEFEGFEKT